MKANKGVLITGVLQNGPAAQAGVRPGDVMVEVGGKPIANVSEMLSSVAALKPGSATQFKLQRRERQDGSDVDAGHAAQAGAARVTARTLGASRYRSAAGHTVGCRPLFGRLRVLDEDLGRPDAQFVQQAHRAAASASCDTTSGGVITAGDDEGQHDEVARGIPSACRPARCPCAPAHHHDRHLEGQPKARNMVSTKLEVGLDVRRRRDALGREALDEIEHLAEHEEVTERHAHEEQQRCWRPPAAAPAFSRANTGPARQRPRPGTAPPAGRPGRRPAAGSSAAPGTARSAEWRSASRPRAGAPTSGAASMSYSAAGPG